MLTRVLLSTYRVRPSMRCPCWVTLDRPPALPYYCVLMLHGAHSFLSLRQGPHCLPSTPTPEPTSTPTSRQETCTHSGPAVSSPPPHPQSARGPRPPPHRKRPLPLWPGGSRPRCGSPPAAPPNCDGSEPGMWAVAKQAYEQHCRVRGSGVRGSVGHESGFACV